MKYQLVLLFIFFLSSNTNSANERSYSCRSNRFLKSSFELSLTKRGEIYSAKLLSVASSEICYLSTTTNGDDSLILTPLGNSMDGCFLVNWSRPETERALSEIVVRKTTLTSDEGYLRLSLDNTMAEYGPQLLTSFVYCSVL